MSTFLHGVSQLRYVMGVIAGYFLVRAFMHHASTPGGVWPGPELETYGKALIFAALWCGFWQLSDPRRERREYGRSYCNGMIFLSTLGALVLLFGVPFLVVTGVAGIGDYMTVGFFSASVALFGLTRLFLSIREAD